LGIRDGGRIIKFYQEQLEDAKAGLITFINSHFSGITEDQYYMIQKELGEEPVLEDIPPRFDDLLVEAQEAWIIYNSLQDIWEGMSGTFMGKNKAGLFDLFRIYEVVSIKEVMSLISTIENEYVQHYMRQQKQKAKKAKH